VSIISMAFRAKLQHYFSTKSNRDSNSILNRVAGDFVITLEFRRDPTQSSSLNFVLLS